MNKTDLILSLAAKEKLAEKLSTDIVNLIFTGFTDTLKRGGRNDIRGFVTFSVREYKAYTGRNPRTGKDVDVWSKKLPFFKVGKELREMVNRSNLNFKS